MPEGSQSAYEIALAHFIVSDDVERSRRFYTGHEVQRQSLLCHSYDDGIDAEDRRSQP